MTRKRRARCMFCRWLAVILEPGSRIGEIPNPGTGFQDSTIWANPGKLFQYSAIFPILEPSSRVTPSLGEVNPETARGFF